MPNSDLSLDDLEFEVDVAIRYHDRRRAFFDAMNRLVAGVTVVAGSAALAGLIIKLKGITGVGEWVILGGAFIVTILNAWSLVSGFAVQARDHDDLCRRYIRLDADIAGSEHTVEKVRSWRSQFLLIQHDAPPTYWAVYGLCWNEAVEYKRRDESARRNVNWWYRRFLVRNFFQQRSDKFPPVSVS